jgi:cell wall-associated NlpC family hydrolase
VDRARGRAVQKARDVSSIKAEMALAEGRLRAADLRAEQASEAYNAALWRLQRAKDAYRAAHTAAVRARRTVSAQRDHIGALVAQSAQLGGDLSALDAIMSADGPEGILDQFAAFQGASTSLQADYQRYTATDSLARVFEARAASAKARQVRMAAVAKQAQARASAAAEAAQREASAIAAQKAQLLRELAQAEHVSVAMARARQAALAEIARRRAEERARRLAVAAARARAAAAAKERAAAAADRAWARAHPRHRGDHTTGGGSWSAPPVWVPPVLTDPGPAPTGGAEQAIRFARAQLGKPYQWGAAGPGTWDCSGLTMRAWQSAGRLLPHYSVAQYLSGTPIPVSAAGPGDLLFWSSNGMPSGIHHVALALGGGRFIEAPHTGADVRYDSVYLWYPDFAVRL